MTALQSILECNAAFVALAIERKFIEHCLDRLVGHLANQVDELVLYLRLLKAILCNNNDAQLKAMELHLPNRFASMWPHISNPVVLKEWLENILKHASSLKQHSSLAFTVLKSIVLSGDCVQATIRYGYVSKFMGLLASQLYKRRRGKAQAPIIPYVLDVLVNISFSAEGRAEICQNESLRDILQDLFDTPGLERLATLFCRNLSFATIAKTQLAQWKAVMQTLLSLLAHDDKFICNYASTAIWSILYNNQRVTSSVLTELNSFAKIQQAREFYTQALNSSSLHESDQILLQEALENLEHIQKLIQHSNDNAKDARIPKLILLSVVADTIALPRVKFDSSNVTAGEEDEQPIPQQHSKGMASRQQQQQAPPPKPKRNYQVASEDDHDAMDPDEGYAAPPMMPRRGRSTRAASQSPPSSPQGGRTMVAPLKTIEGDAETTIGVAVKMKGELSFERLLRIEGEFEGKLISKGSLVVGHKGLLNGNIDGMKEVLVAGGRVLGNIQVDRLVLRDKGQIFGNVTAKSVRIDPDCILVGTLNINPHAPQKINLKGEPIADEPAPPPS
ncbi:unnamed protein product [Aphanomyces euteiches]